MGTEGQKIRPNKALSKEQKQAITRILILCFCASFFIWAGCGKKSESRASSEVVGGVEFVHNTKIPLYPKKSLLLEKDLSISFEDEAGNIIIYLPGWYAVDEEENVYISDYQDNVIKVFDAQGEVKRTIGRKGDGPGEFQNIGRFVLLPENRLLVLDWSTKRISLLDGESNFVSSHNFQNNSYDIYFATPGFYVREDIVFGKVIEEWLLERLLYIKAYDYAGKELFSFGEFVHYHSQVINEEGRGFTISPTPFDVRSIVAGDQKHLRLYHCLNDQYLIEAYDGEGKLFRKIDRPYTALPTTEKDIADYLEGFRARGSSERDLALIEKNIVIPRQKTVTDRMIVDDEGFLWVEMNEAKEADGVTLTAYDVFDIDGYYAFRVWMEKQPGIIKKGKLYRMETDQETGYRTLNRYRMTWSE